MVPRMGEAPDIRRKRLLFRSWHRGTREIDLLLGSFAEQHLAGMSEDQLTRYEVLLEENDAALFDWITGRSPPPEELDTDVLRLLMEFRFRPRPA
jgi:antitoxin CptB